LLRRSALLAVGSLDPVEIVAERRQPKTSPAEPGRLVRCIGGNSSLCSPCGYGRPWGRW
jgi:hypothetical protein